MLKFANCYLSRSWAVAILSALAMLLGASFDRAVAMAVKAAGPDLIMIGGVKGDECKILEQAFKQNPALRTVVLRDSLGGNADAGYCVGEKIREYGLNTEIDGYCESSCSRMFLGGVHRKLSGPKSRVGLHGTYDSKGDLLPEAPKRLREWLPRFAGPGFDTALMEQWINLPRNTQAMWFTNSGARLCDGKNCTTLPGRTALSLGLTTP